MNFRGTRALVRHGSTAKKTAFLSDVVSVRGAEEFIDWDMKLTAVSMDDPQRLVRFLTGGLVACGAWVLTRSVSERESAEISFEFARACCVEIYAVLIAAGLQLGRDSHLRLTELCHCTKNLIGTKAFDIARVSIVVYMQEADPGQTAGRAEDQAQIA